MAKKYDVIALGELLIDFTMNGQSTRQNINQENLHKSLKNTILTNMLLLQLVSIFKKNLKSIFKAEKCFLTQTLDIPKVL